MYGTGRNYVPSLVSPRVDKQECATPDLSCTICRYPAPTAEFFVYVTFFQRNAALPQSSVRARAGHRPCSVKPSQVHEGKLSKRLAARASSKRLRQQKIPPWANPSGVAHSCLSTLGITYPQRISNTALYARTEQTPLSQVCRQRRLLWFGHVVREGEESSSFQALLMSINTTDIRRPRGRPRLRWIDVVKKDLQCINLSLLDAVQSASDRAAWLEIVKGKLNAKNKYGLSEGELGTDSDELCLEPIREEELCQIS